MIIRTPKPSSYIVVLLTFVFAIEAFSQQFGTANRGRTGNTRTGGGVGASGSREYYSSGTVGEALVTSDPETRRLIVITDEETSQYVGQVVTNLDQPRPQVLINVVFL